MEKMRIFPIIMILIFGFVTSSFGDAASPQEQKHAALGGKVAIADLLEIAYQQNPSVRAAKAAWRASVEEYRVATAFPDPQIMFTYFPEPIQTRLGPQDWNAVISQMLPFPGKLVKAGEIAQADARIARLNLDRTVRDIAVSLLESCHELAYIREAKAIAARNAELLDHLRKVGETAYAQDRAALNDMVKAQSQTAQLRYDILLLEELELTELTRLNGLLNRPPDAPLGRLEELPFRPLVYDLEAVYERAAARQEEIRIAQAKADKAEAQIGMAEYQNLPDFKVGLFYASIGDPDMNPPPDAGDDAVGLQFGVSIPIWLGKQDGRLEKAKARAEQIRAEKEARVLGTRTQIRNLFFRLQNARRLISLYKDEMLPQALSAMETAETWFREGEGSFSDFAETQAVLYNFQLSLARARADYGKYLARMEQLAGQSLTEKNGNPGEKAEE